MTTQGTPRVLVIAFDVFAKSTRARKFCRAYEAAGTEVQYLGMSKPGRSGRWGDPGSSLDGATSVFQVPMQSPQGGTGKASQIRNLFFSYLPALTRMAIYTLRHDADVVHVVGAPLSPLGLIHKVRHRSRLVLDIQERPGAIATPGSLSSLFAKVERSVLAQGARASDAASVVTPPDVAVLKQIGFKNVNLVRNAPLRSWRSPYRDPKHPRTETTFACIGTIFEGRAFESLIDAVGKVGPKASIQLHISGTGSDSYMQALKKRAEECGASPYIEWRGWVSAGDVCDRYLDADVGLVLYDTTISGNDGLSNKLLECVAAGRPALCTNGSLNQQFIDALKVGWTTPSDTDSLAEALLTVATTEDLREIARHCRAVGDEQLSWEAESADLLSQVLQGKASRTMSS
ncbi:glycosyltransferase [Luteococcus sp. H138]|uniref:glycosyltransferase n=1 Tax=unclassified Luteococcus TaxID=2639923 RepID=UPI00313F17C6